MTNYPCILITKKELHDQAKISEIPEKNGTMNTTFRTAVEDYCGRPVVSIINTPEKPNIIIVLTADGYMQYNPVSQKRTVVLVGEYDNLKVILHDIFLERPDEDPYEIFQSYAYQTDITNQLDLQEWVRNTIQPKWKHAKNLS